MVVENCNGESINSSVNVSRIHADGFCGIPHEKGLDKNFNLQESILPLFKVRTAYRPHQ
jgi:hypothetical protein